MDSLEQIPNIRHLITKKVEELEKLLKTPDELLTLDDIEKLHNDTVELEKQMEETIDLCVEFYEMELPDVENYQQDLKKLRARTRVAWAELSKRVESRRIQNERMQLLQKSQELRNRGKKTTQKDQSKEITQSLQNTLRIVREDIDSLHHGGTILSEDDDTMDKTNSILYQFSESMKQSLRITNRMGKREVFERRALLASILTLLFVVLYIVFTRVTRITKVVLWVPMTFIRLIENAIHMVIWNLNMNEAVQHVEELVKKKASTLSEEEKRELKEFSKVFNPRLEQMEKNVNTAKIVVGRNKDPSFNEFAKATAGLKRLLRVCRQNLQINEEKILFYHQKAIEARKQGRDADCKNYLLLKKSLKESTSKLRKNIQSLYDRLHDVTEADMCNDFFVTMEKVSEALTVISENLASLQPDELSERIDALDQYLNEIDAAIEPDEPEDLDDYYKEIDDLIENEEKEKVSALPSAPTTQVKSVSVSEKEKRVADLE